MNQSHTLFTIQLFTDLQMRIQLPAGNSQQYDDEGVQDCELLPSEAGHLSS